jgi:hypothetical protein
MKNYVYKVDLVLRLNLIKILKVLIKVLHLGQESIRMNIWIKCDLDKSNRWHKFFKSNLDEISSKSNKNQFRNIILITN